MAHGFNNRVWCDTATTGTGNVTIGSPKPAHCTPAQAGTVNADTRTWLLEEGNDFEIFRGAYTASGTVVTRGTVLLSQIAGSTGTTRMNLAGTATIREVAAAEDLLSIVVPADARAALGLSFVSRSITASTTVVSSDLGKTLLLTASSTYTLGLDAAATLGNGFWCNIRNIGPAVVTLDANLSETIDGKSTMMLGPGEAISITCTGAAFYTDASGGKLVEIARVTNPNTATVDFDFGGGWPADFDEFEVHFIDIAPSVDDVFFGLRTKTGSPTPVTQTSGYAYMGRVQGPTAGADTGSSIESLNDRICLTRSGTGQGVGNSTGEVLNGILYLNAPNGINIKQARFCGTYQRSDGLLQQVYNSGYYGSNTLWTGIRFLFSSGNILNGTIILYGRLK